MPDRRSQPPRLVSRAVDFRATDDTEQNDGRTLEGYAAVFDAPTEINSWEGVFTETIAKGAFRKTLRERTPVLQFDHGRDARTGSVPIGSFENLSEDDTGLAVRARLFDNPVVEPIRQAIEGHAITGMSFRFEIMREEWRDKDGKTIKPGPDLWDALWENEDPADITRTIKEVKLFEAGPVVFPAYEQTSVGVRDVLNRLWTPEEIAEISRQLGIKQAGQKHDEKTYDRPELNVERDSPSDEPSPELDSNSEPGADHLFWQRLGHDGPGAIRAGSVGQCRQATTGAR